MKAFAYLVALIFASITGIFTFNIFNSASADSVPLLKVKTDNSELKHQLPKFYDCISSQVWHSKDKQSDPYFKSEPTLNEVLKCYNKVLSKEGDNEDGNHKVNTN